MVPNSHYDTAGETCARISCLDAVWAATIAHTMCQSWRVSVLCPEPGLWFGNFPQTTAESNDTPLINCVQHVHQSVYVYFQLPSGLQCDPIQIVEVVQQEYILISGVWLSPRVNVANTFHLSKNHSYCMQRQNSERKNRSPEHHLIADCCDRWMTNSTTPQYAHIILWCQW